MGYYIRVLTPSTKRVPLKEIEQAFAAKKIKAKIISEAGEPDAREEAVIAHPDGTEIAAVGIDPVEEGSLGQEEINEFLEMIEDCKPYSAVEWLRNYLPTVKTIYAFQILFGADKDDGWDAVHAFQTVLWSKLGGIFQADGEGFSNEDGYHILWDFGDKVSGPWNMGVLKDGKWVHFEMDLGNKKHREAFFKGEVPAGVKIL